MNNTSARKPVSTPKKTGLLAITAYIVPYQDEKGVPRTRRFTGPEASSRARAFKQGLLTDWTSLGRIRVSRQPRS